MDNKDSGQDDQAAPQLTESGESLEYNAADATQPQTSLAGDNQAITQDTPGAQTGGDQSQSGKHASLRRLWDNFNIYLLLFVLVVVIASSGVVVMYIKNRSQHTATTGNIDQQQISADALAQLAANGVQVGDPKQTLNVQSNSVFAGSVLVKGEVQAAGGLKIGSGSLAIPEITVNGGANINQIDTQTLDVAGTLRANDVSILKNLSVNGSGTFNGSLTTAALSVGRLQLNGDLTISRHLVAAGVTPGRSNGNALGSGGTSSVSGSDTAGAVTINTGSSPAAGCFTTVTFANPFNATPHIVITPVGSAAADVKYYVNRNTTSFSVCSADAPPANSTFGFDYHIFD